MTTVRAGKRTRRPAAKPVPPAPDPAPAVTPDGRPAIGIGDALTRDDHWGPKLTPLPCGYCAAAPPVPDDILDRTQIIGHVNWLAGQAGWRFDVDIILTCPACQQDEAWQARQGPLEVARSHDCGRHYCGRGDANCTCPGAVLAVDVMLTSNDYADIGTMFDDVERRYRAEFAGQYRALHPERFRPGRHRAPDPFQRRGAA